MDGNDSQLTKFYISRTLVADRGTQDERVISESEITGLRNRPLIILGEPGIGKTDLTKSVERITGGFRINAGTFSRTEDLTEFEGKASPLIIDGLDEVGTSAGGTALDSILVKLSRLGHPNFVVSCRAADWRGSADRHKIEQDYGATPLTLHIQPFSADQALAFLHAFDDEIDADELLDGISQRGLNELIGNPLTLGLIAEVFAEKGELPETRADLLERASNLLVMEKNRAHVASQVAQAPVEELLMSAGGIFAHLLISGSVGIAIAQRDGLPEGYVDRSQLGGIADVNHSVDVVGTRLFRSDGEGLFIPVHRVIAEYLGGRWLGEQLRKGLSETRVFQALTVAGGIPGPLRGLHAWLGHFNTTVANRCIQADPYGVLRYGEPDKLPSQRAKLLLESLRELANEDPYFRSEDWSVRAVSGLARPDLKDEIISVVRSPERHLHLSSLLLEALPGSTLTEAIAPELTELINDEVVTTAERLHAAEALISSGADINWSVVVKTLRGRTRRSEKRLGLEIIGLCKGNGFTAKEIADALIDYQGITRDRERVDREVGVVSGFLYRLPAVRCPEILDSMASSIKAAELPRYESLNSALNRTLHKLVLKALDTGDTPPPERLWSWLRYLDSRQGSDADARDKIRAFLEADPETRFEIQRLALRDENIDDGPWMAIVHVLPSISDGLFLSAEDVALHLREIHARNKLSNHDISLWSDLMRYQWRDDGVPQVVAKAATEGASKHSKLADIWEEFRNPPPIPEWKKEQDRRQRRYEREQAAKWAKHRSIFKKDLDAIRQGTEIGALQNLSNGYLGRFNDLNRDATPLDRLTEWVGQEIATAATDGFLAVLSRDDLPTADKIASVRLEGEHGKHFTVEPVMLCGVAEMVRRGKPLTDLSAEVLQSVLTVWWDMPEFNSSELGNEIEQQLESCVLHCDEAIEQFAATTMEPGIRAGHSHVSGLYRFLRNSEYREAARNLSIKWLSEFPNAHISIQYELLECAMKFAASSLEEVTSKRLANIEKMETPERRMWTAAGFIFGQLDGQQFAKAVADDKNLIWAVRDLARYGWRLEGPQWPLTLWQLETIVESFGGGWKLEERPTGVTSGDNNPWDAADFIMSCISGISANPTDEASAILDRLVANPSLQSYQENIKHARAQQRRVRRDQEFLAPDFDTTKGTLAGSEPGTIDDLKAVMLDELDRLQKYVRDSETDAWDAFWDAGQPKDENTCRHRTLDLLRPTLTQMNIDLIPECLMPEQNRTDIVALHKGKGVPVEVKGQWHSNVWDASTTQLDDGYVRDWRAEGRGIYLVLWFGRVRGKNIPRHPDKLSPPKTPDEFQTMLEDRLSESQRSRIDVRVLDVSRPEAKKSKRRLSRKK